MYTGGSFRQGDGSKQTPRLNCSKQHQGEERDHFLCTDLKLDVYTAAVKATSVIRAMNMLMITNQLSLILAMAEALNAAMPGLRFAVD